MHRLFFVPDDYLFHRDGRPMSGSLSGDGARWPEPNVLSSALHAAFHQRFPVSQGKRRFGDLQSAGPWPVDPSGQWCFPRPLDLGADGRKCHAPGISPTPAPSSLSAPLTMPVFPLRPPSKTSAPAWCTAKGFADYLNGRSVHADADLAGDAKFFASEFSYGIGLEDDTGATEKGAFYSARRLRLREGVRLGACVTCAREQEHGIAQVFDDGSRILLGGDRRTCRVTLETSTATTPGAIPESAPIDSVRVRWTLLSPAIFPALRGTDGREQPGGWLPNWVDPDNGEVRLLDGPGGRKARRLGLPEGRPIAARLVAALVDAPKIVSGWSLSDPGGGGGGAKLSLRAVPAGSVYYFEAESVADAQKLSEALSWHGAGRPDAIRQRRSTLMGEKGYGLGVCSSWSTFDSLRSNNL